MQNRTSILEKFKKAVNPDDPVTYLEGLELAGAIWGQTYAAKAHALFRSVIWNMAIMHFLMKIVMEHDHLNLQVMMEALHWAVINWLGSAATCAMMANTNTFREIHAMIKSGIFTYVTPLNERQKNIIREEEKRIHFLIKLFFTLMTVAFVCTQLKGVLFERDQWGLQFPGWFPFEINSLGTYIAGFSFQFIMGLNLVVNAQALSVSFTALSGHLCTQLRILVITVENVFKEPRDYRETKKRMKACVQHHHAIILFHEKFQSYYNVVLFVLATSMIMMLCLIGCVVTDPHSDMLVIIPLLTVFVPEMVIVIYFCYAGQRITDESENLNLMLFEIKWYLEPPAIRKDLMLILIKSQKTFKMVGGGIQTFNLKGLSEILQTSYTYFNMLVALRK